MAELNPEQVRYWRTFPYGPQVPRADFRALADSWLAQREALAAAQQELANARRLHREEQRRSADRLRAVLAAIEDALGRHQVTHIHAALRVALASLSNNSPTSSGSEATTARRDAPSTRAQATSGGVVNAGASQVSSTAGTFTPTPETPCFCSCHRRGQECHDCSCGRHVALASLSNSSSPKSAKDIEADLDHWHTLHD